MCCYFYASGWAHVRCRVRREALPHHLGQKLYGSVLVAKLYSAESIDRLLSETDEVVTRRRHLLEIEAMLTKAMTALDEVQGIGTKVVMG